MTDTPPETVPDTAETVPEGLPTGSGGIVFSDQLIEVWHRATNTHVLHVCTSINPDLVYRREDHPNDGSFVAGTVCGIGITQHRYRGQSFHRHSIEPTLRYANICHACTGPQPRIIPVYGTHPDDTGQAWSELRGPHL